MLNECWRLGLPQAYSWQQIPASITQDAYPDQPLPSSTEGSIAAQASQLALEPVLGMPVLDAKLQEHSYKKSSPLPCTSYFRVKGERQEGDRIYSIILTAEGFVSNFKC